MSDRLQELVEMSRYLGDPARPYVILGEGNTSARIDEGSLHVKASGTTLAGITAGGFVAVSIAGVLRLLDDAAASDEDVDQALRDALLDPKETRKPSVETLLHAVLLEYPEYNFVAHTHPVATNAILCSRRAREAMEGRVCPDQIVVMGHKSVFVPYVDPGLVLAREVRERVRRFVEEEGVMPRAIMLENHGSIALASTAKDVIGITQMTEKTSQILVGAYSAGGATFLSAEHVRRIDTRPDELYRRKVLEAGE